MRLQTSAYFFAVWSAQLLASSACFAQAFDPYAGANPVSPSPSMISGTPANNLPYSSADSQTTLPSSVVPERYRLPSGATNNVPAQGGGVLAAPAVTYTMPVTTADQAARIEYQNQLTIVNAIDAGKVQALQQHFAQIHFWQTSGAYTPGPINLNFLDQAGNTPAIRAAYRGNVDVLKALVAEGASVQGVNYAGQSAGSIATQYGHTDFANYVTNLAAAPAPTYVAQAPAYSAYSSNSAGGAGGSIVPGVNNLVLAGGVGLAGVGVAAIALGGSSGDDSPPPTSHS